MRVLQVTAFAPRGGSAQVVRYLSKALISLGLETSVVSGSIPGERPMGDAAHFFQGLPLVEVDYAEALRGYADGLDPILFTNPMSPSYEDKGAVADRAFYQVDNAGLEHLVKSWRRVLGETTASFKPDLLHLHHLHHVHLAAIEMPELAGTPKLAHLHGTELKMLRWMQQLRSDPSLHTELWEKALKRAAAGVDHFVVNSEAVASEAGELLEAPGERISVIPNGVDTELFRPRQWSTESKLRYLERLLVEAPRGWDESGVEGSIRYRRRDLRNLLDEGGGMRPVALYAGRFLAFKRVDMLLEGVAELNGSSGRSSPEFNVLICGGAPGEWEGEHPYAIVKRLGLRNVFFCGWLNHEELAQALNLADVFVAPSSYEPFGQVYLEAMATAVPVVGTRSGGPLSFVVDEGEMANGWLSAPDDKSSLVGVLDKALSSAGERDRRGRNAYQLVQRRYSWSRVARRFESLYQRLERASPSRRPPPSV